MNVSSSPTWWTVFGILVFVLLTIDLVAHRGSHGHSRKAALLWSATWIVVALLFNGAVWLFMDAERAEEFFAAYVLEKSLSLDNMFVFFVVFQSLKIPKDEERRVLSWGIFGALILRGAFIALGVTLLERWHPIIYILGAVLIFTGIKLARSGDEAQKGSRLLEWLKKRLPMTEGLRGHHFLVEEGGRRLITPLFLALIVIELTDVAFAIDSIPAAFAVSNHPFIIYSSNVFALLGLRSLYVLLSHGLSKSRELEIALAAVLVFAGGKMLLSGVVHVPPMISVALIVTCLGGAMLIKVLRRFFRARRADRRAHAGA